MNNGNYFGRFSLFFRSILREITSYQQLRFVPVFIRRMAAMAMLLGFCTAFGQTTPTFVEVRMAAPNVLVAVLTNLTYEQENGTNEEAHTYYETHPDIVDKTGWTVNGTSPTNVYRYSVTWDEREFNAWLPGPYTLPITTRHRLYLCMNSNLQEGTGYTISHPNYGSINLTFHATNIFCESIKVNQAGYSKLHTNRFANYGVFRGEGGSMHFNTLPTYKVYNESSGAVLTSGQAIYIGDDTGSSGFQVRNSGEHVYRLSLNGLPEGGPYYVSVDGAGRSRSFGIGDNYSSNIAYVTMRGIYLHRCGIALTNPLTPFTHAICHTNIYDTRLNVDQDKLDVDTGKPTMFIQGGYHDAGDMDQPEGHTQISILMLSFFESFPDRFTTNQYKLPESGNGIPDFLNEILWGVKAWEYLQITNASEGALRGGVRAGWSTRNYTGYGDQDAANDTVAVPGRSSPHLYGTFNVREDCTAMVAGLFAQTARLLRPYPSQAAHAADLLYRAQLAWNYLATNPNYNVTEARARYAYSSLQLYLATTNSYYHSIFQSAITNLLNGHGASGQNNQRETYDPGTTDATLNTAHFVSYLLPNVPNPNTTVVQTLKNKILYYTDHDSSAGGPPQDNAYPQGIYNNVGGNWLQYGTGTAQGLYADVWMYACLVATDPATLQKCTNAVAQYADSPLGLNAMAMSYYTGLGTDQPNSVLDCNSYFTKYGVYDGVPLPDGTHDDYGGANNPIGQVPGICVYGPQYDEATNKRDLPLERKMVPYWTNLPPQRRYTHGQSFPRVNEFTVNQTLLWNALMYAFLYKPTGGTGGTDGNGSRPLTTAPHTSAPMTIDGNLSEAGWIITNTVTKSIVGTNNNTVTFGILWDENYLYVGAKVLDGNLYNDSATTSWQDDSIEIYIDGNRNRGASYDSYDRQIVKGWNNPALWVNGSQTNGILHASTNITGGYSVEVAIPWTNFGITANSGVTIGFDVANNDDDNGGNRESQVMWSGTANNWTDTSAFGDLTLARPSITAQRPSGPITIDGNLSEASWSVSNSVTKTIVGTNNNTITFGVLWDSTNLYVGAKVLDGNLYSDSGPSPWQDDSIEIYIDGNHNRGTTYDSYDRQIVKGWNTSTIWVNGNQTNGIRHAWASISGGYSVEVAIPWSNIGITPTAGTVIGFDVANNDDDDGGLRESQNVWSGTATNWSDTSAFGDLTLAIGAPSAASPEANMASLYPLRSNTSDSMAKEPAITLRGNAQIDSGGYGLRTFGPADSAAVTFTQVLASASTVAVSVEANIFVNAFNNDGSSACSILTLDNNGTYSALNLYQYPSQTSPEMNAWWNWNQETVVNYSTVAQYLTVGQWHHVTLTVDSTGFLFEVDGQRLLRTTNTAALPYWQSAPPVLEIGHLNGWINDVVVRSVQVHQVNIDFGAGSGPSTKQGLAAAPGQNSSDFWNFYTRDYNGGWRSSGSLTNVLYSDTTYYPAFPITMNIDNAAGAWGNGSPDPMYNSYLYPYPAVGNATISFTGVASGYYDLYVYGIDAHFQLSVGSTNYGTQQTSNSTPPNPVTWQEGNEYVRFRSIRLKPGDPINITVLPGVSGYATFSGLQFVTVPSSP
jgi:endoglucanase